MTNDRQKKEETRRPLPIGISDFRKLRENDYHYVDKSLFVRDVTRSSAEVLLISRPRRFGKTLNLSMLRYFYEKSGEDRKPLFDGLAIRDDEVFNAHHGKYPVIWMTFKDLKDRSWESMLRGIGNLVRDEFIRHEAIFDSKAVPDVGKRYCERILKDEAVFRDYEDALRYLSHYLCLCHNKQVVILIDEYDTPLHAGYEGGFYEEMISFMRNFLSGGLKDNGHLFRGVVTGVFRVAKESVFSGLNNLGVHTILSAKFSEAFGFTEPEVRRLLSDRGMGDCYENASYWYNGYRFGNKVIWNPWSC